MPAHKGITISPGIGVAACYQFMHTALDVSRRQPADPPQEWSRLKAAMDTSARKLEAAYQHALAYVGPQQAEILQAHLTMLNDPELRASIKALIFEHSYNVEAAVHEASEAYCAQLEALDDEYLRARATDIRDVRNEILQALLGVDDAGANSLPGPSIVVSRSLTPSDCLSLDRGLIRGFCTMEGGPTSHVSILARSLGIPAIVGVDEGALKVPNGTTVILDGDTGTMLHGLDDTAVGAFEQKREARMHQRAEAKKQALAPAITLDGHQVEVIANIGTSDLGAAQSCLDHGAEGVGLLRTEFVYLECARMPDEELQAQKYRAILDVFGDRPVVLRTVDIGGDKDLPYFQLPRELNPFLGVRGLRLSLRYPEMFKTQLRAALRAGYQHNLRIMFPMVTKAAEIRQARSMLNDARRSLESEGRPFARDVQVGIMIEVPAAALLADQLSDEVDFFSIGTNDLSQYTFAMDRTNAEVSKDVDALDPSVLRLIATVINAGHAANKKVAVCGELAGEPVAIPILLGLGLDEFSMNAPAIPTAKKIIRSLQITEARAVALQTLQYESAGAVRRRVLEAFPQLEE